MKTYDSVPALLTEMQKEALAVKKEIRRLPKGALMIQLRNGRPQYFRVTYNSKRQRKRVVINDDMELVYRLAHKMYLMEKLRRLEVDMTLCEKPGTNWLQLDNLSIMSAMPRHFEVLEYKAVVDASCIGGKVFCPNPVNDGSVAPVDAQLNIGSADIDEWASKPYCVNTKYEERKIHRTSNGLMCRTKGEVSLIELCNRLGYRYHYDETVWVCGKLRSPDLIIVRSDGSLVYVEHRGWKGEDYERANLEKDRLYFNAGIRQGRNYLITFESDDGAIDIELVEMQLRKIVEG